MKIEDPDKITRVILMGSGGVGFWAAVALARRNDGREILVMDDDTFEGGNGYKRLPFVDNPRESKVSFLKGFIGVVMGDEPPKILYQRLTADWVLTQGDMSNTIVLDLTDMPKAARVPIWAALAHAGAIVWRGSYDGNGVVVMLPGLPIGDPTGGNYALVPTLAQSFIAGGVVASVVHRLLEGAEIDDVEIRI